MRARVKHWALALSSLLLAYVVCEAVATTLYLWGVLEPTRYYFHEQSDPDGNVQRDRAIGYRLSQTPARLVVVSSDGEVRSTGQLQGNDLGFPDRDDFMAADSDGLRLAVFGDSFTAAQYIETNWPDRAEELLHQTSADEPGRKIHLYNMAVDGGGLGNWWSIMSRFIGPNDIDLDGIIIAVCCDDLQRKFVWWDDGMSKSCGRTDAAMALQHSDTWDLEDDPFAIKEDCPGFNDFWRSLPEDEFSTKMADGDWDVHWRRPFEPYLLTRLRNLLVPDANAGENKNETGRLAVVTAMATWLREKEIPVLVLDLAAEENTQLSPKGFAERLGADYALVPNFAPCEEWPADDLKIKYDGHWNQKGSDCFARRAVAPIRDWANTLPAP